MVKMAQQPEELVQEQLIKLGLLFVMELEFFANFSDF